MVKGNLWAKSKGTCRAHREIERVFLLVTKLQFEGCLRIKDYWEKHA